MNIVTHERLILSAALQDRGAIRKLAAELPEMAFGYGPDDKLSDSHRLIYRAMLACYQDNVPIDTATVATRLGIDLKLVGGQKYLADLARALPDAGIASTEGLPEWARVVDNAGRVRGLQAILGRYSDQVTEDIVDIDGLYADLLMDLSNAHSAKTFYHPISEAVAEFRTRLEQERGGKAVSWLPFPWESTKKYRLLPREALVTLTGLSSVGKSQLLAEFLLGSAVQLKKYNLPGVVTFNSYEMKGWRYASRMASCLSGVNLLSESLNDNTSDEYHRLMEATEFIETLPILYDDGDMTSTQILNHSMSVANEWGGIHVVGVDYSELVPDKGSSEELRVSGIFRNAQRLSRTLDACVIVLSQFSGDVLHESTKIGGPGRTRYSRAGWHAAEVVLELYNPAQMRTQGITFEFPSWLPDPDKAYSLIQKNKNGPTGWFAMNWTPGHVRFSDPALAGYGASALFEGLEEVWDRKAHENKNMEGDF